MFATSVGEGAGRRGLVSAIRWLRRPEGRDQAAITAQVQRTLFAGALAALSSFAVGLVAGFVGGMLLA